MQRPSDKPDQDLSGFVVATAKLLGFSAEFDESTRTLYLVAKAGRRIFRYTLSEWDIVNRTEADWIKLLQSVKRENEQDIDDRLSF